MNTGKSEYKFLNKTHIIRNTWVPTPLSLRHNKSTTTRIRTTQTKDRRKMWNSVGNNISVIQKVFANITSTQRRWGNVEYEIKMLDIHFDMKKWPDGFIVTMSKYSLLPKLCERLTHNVSYDVINKCDFTEKQEWIWYGCIELGIP